MLIKQMHSGRWIVKKKFTFAAITGTLGTAFASRGIYFCSSPEEIVLVLKAYSSFCTWLVGLVFAADVADKTFNGGKYDDEGD